MAVVRPIIILIIIVLPLPGLSQESGSCAEKLKIAQTLFSRGQVELVPSMISECMKSGFTREESLDAYKLLIQSYLFEDKLEKADSAMLEFLKKNPEYALSPTDHSSFVHLFNNFLVKPVLQLSIHLGTNVPFLTFIREVGVAGEPGPTKYSSELINLFISVESKFELNKKLEINFEPGFSQLSFTNVEEFVNTTDNEVIKISKTTYSEIQRRIEMPVSLTYNLKSFGRFTPYGRLGVGTALCLGSTATAENKPAAPISMPLTGPDMDRKASRISVDIFGQVGAGVKFKINGGFLFTELRSNLGFFNQVVNGGNPTIEQELGFKYSYADDDFHLNAVNFSVGYTQIFYKPSKRK